MPTHDPAPAITIELPESTSPGPGAGNGWSLAVPSVGGVLSFDGRDDRPLLLLVCANARDAARSRLLPAPSNGPTPSLRTDLRSITRRVRYWPVGSRFEGDCLFHRIAHQEKPELARAALDRASGWFVQINPDDRFPRWRVLATNELAGESDGSRPPGTLLGPIRDKHAAGRLIDGLNELFDLCRYHHILVRSPDAQPCAYKELGRCPAPCDGSESMDDYRARIREALRFWHEPDRWHDAGERAMRLAAVELDFELAAAWKERLALAERLGGGALAHARGFWESGWLALAGTGHEGSVRCLLVGAMGVHPLGEMSAELSASDAWKALGPILENSGCLASPRSIDPLGWHLLGTVTMYLYSGSAGGSRRKRRLNSSPGSSGAGSSIPPDDQDTGESKTPSDRAVRRRWGFVEFVACSRLGDGCSGPSEMQCFTQTGSGGTVGIGLTAANPDRSDPSDWAFAGAWKRATAILCGSTRSRPASSRSPARTENDTTD